MRRFATTTAGMLLASLFLTEANAADAFSGRRNTRAYQLDQAVYEVVARTAGSGGVYWCGAADYARIALNAGWQDRIYVARGRGPSVATGRKTAIQFSLQPVVVDVQPNWRTLFPNSFLPGDSMSVEQANRYCDMPRVRP